MITNRDISWYTLALKVAEESQVKDRHGCVLVRSGCVLGLATNRRVNSHPTSNKFKKCDIHAEQRALFKVKDAAGATLYSARTHCNPISKPCEMCLFLLRRAKVKWIVYHNGLTLQKTRI